MASQIAYPVRVEARLSDDLSRWLWLVKWLLVIPHYFVLAFLWLAFFAMSVAAFFAILFTGRYPRAIFDFNLGVLRWSWRVAYYAYGALGTDRYPPFTLDDVADYPAHLEVAYPEKLSRGLVLVKWWLLAIPHYIIVAIFMGGTWLALNGEQWEVSGFGLITLLAVVAGVILAFTGSYPKPLFDLLLGFNRWVIRVAAYAGLMTDTYPPFRLDSGGTEPGGTVTTPPSTGGGSAPSPPPHPPPATTVGTTTSTRSGWTAGPIISLILGCLLALTSLGLFAGGVLALWVDATQREDGFVTSPDVHLSTDSYALVSENIEIRAEGPDWVVPEAIIGDGRVRVTGSEDVFVGIGPTAEVRRYLTGVSYSFAPDLSTFDGRHLAATPGDAPSAPPAAEDFWLAESAGGRTRSITWPVDNGSWSIVVMNADAARGVDVEVSVGAEAPAIGAIAVGLLIAGGVLLLIAVALIGGGIARAGRPTGERKTA